MARRHVRRSYGRRVQDARHRGDHGHHFAAPDAAGITLLRDAAAALALSVRGSHRTLRVGRTLADLDGEDCVARIHIAEALSYRGETLRRAQVGA
ncbi:MAG: magnesium chelatase subunit ChlI family protein [Methyloceanibacter sp.]